MDFTSTTYHKTHQIPGYLQSGVEKKERAGRKIADSDQNRCRRITPLFKGSLGRKLYGNMHVKCKFDLSRGTRKIARVGSGGRILSSTVCGILSTIALCAAKLCGVSIVWILAALGPGGDICECPWIDRRICDGACVGLRRGKDLVFRSSTNVEGWEEEHSSSRCLTLWRDLEPGRSAHRRVAANKELLETRCRMAAGRQELKYVAKAKR